VNKKINVAMEHPVLDMNNRIAGLYLMVDFKLVLGTLSDV